MSIDLLFADFDRLIQSSESVHRLRRFILDLAVRGKLVPQDPNDEPTSELLKRIAAEKARLVKAGKIKKPRVLDGSEPITIPFVVPQSWQWVRLDSVGAIIGGGTPSANEAKNFATPGQGIPWLTPADLGGYSELFISRGTRDLSDTGLQSSSATLMPKGTVLFTSRAPIGYVAIAANPISTNQGFKSIFPYVLDCSRFVAIAMKAFASEIDATAPGTTFKEVSGKIVAGVPFPLPPLAEQRRIVAKVDELMALCDRLETVRAEREAKRDRLATASLARLNTPDSEPAIFQHDVASALNNLTPLTTRPDQIKALRQTILNLAVRGKLVRQDPNDEPASELLKRIAAEKTWLAKSGTIRKRKTSEPAAPDSLAFKLPSGWAAAKFSDVLTELQTGPFGSSLHQNDYEIGGTPVINPASMRDGKIVPVEKMAVGADILERLATFKLQVGDIVMGRRGEMGRCAVVTEQENGWLCGTGSLILRLPQCLYPEYLAMLIGSPYVREYLGGFAVGATMQNLNQSILLKMSIGLPPLAEQHRMVAKVSELMVLCDRLEENLGTTDDIRGCLPDALLH